MKRVLATCFREVTFELRRIIFYYTEVFPCEVEDYCSSRVPFRHRVALSLATGLLFGFAHRFEPLSLHLILACIFLFFVEAVAYIDQRHMVIVDEILFPFVPLGLLHAALSPRPWHEFVSGALLGYTFFILIYIFSRGRLGFGDVKYAGVLGLWLGAPGTVTCIGLAFLTGGCVAAFICLQGGATAKTKVPFGPYLSLGAVISYFYASQILSWYCSLCL